MNKGKRTWIRRKREEERQMEGERKVNKEGE